MSQTTTAPALSLAQRVTEWAQPITAYMALGAFLAAMGLAYWRQDAASINLLIGAVISMANTVINYFFGSSRSSAAKDATIAQIATAPPPPITTGTTA